MNAADDFFFDDFGTECDGSSQAALSIDTPTLVALIRDELKRMANDVELDCAWNVDDLSPSQLAFLQTLDHQSQLLKQWSQLLRHIEPRCNGAVEIDRNEYLERIVSSIESVPSSSER